ncbi:MAG TPA: hypothetical protein VGQ34_00835 [Sphingomicrobium sp.]|nr:hypothetical protein [Sphingomicrobium sp.]
MIAALLMFAQIVPAPEEPKPAQTTIAAIRASPKKFDGLLVRLHGYVNHCQPLDCSVEERPAAGPGGAGEVLSIDGDAKFNATITPLLPTYVEFDARVNAKCLISACNDRAPVLTIVTLRAVVSPEPPPFEKP